MFYPTHLHFTRQQIAELTGVSDEILAFWLKHQLLVTNGDAVSGRGRHKRFGYVQIHIAAILNQLRNFGVNISGLRSVSEILQAAVKTGERVVTDELRRSDCLHHATHFENVSQEYLHGKKRSESKEIGSEWRECDTFDEWFATYVEKHSYDPALNDAIALYNTLKPGEGRLIGLYVDLTNSGHFQRGADGGRGWDEYVFSIAPSSKGEWLLVAYEEDTSSLKEWMAEPPSYISIRVSKLIRDIWQPKKSQTAY